ALKGVLAHHVASLYGGHERWRGVTWDGHRIAKGPGELYRTLFGAPDADDDPKNDPGARAGNVVFHDALYIPSSCAMDRPFAREILTVHLRPYYDKHGQTAPNDYEDPVPVGFLNVRPGACFLLALSGRADWTELALALLLEALRARGVGGKTSLGYGRLA